MALNKKTTALFKLMELFLTQKEISPYDKAITDEFGCDKKTIERYLKEIESLYSHIITIKRSRKNVWKLITVSEIFEEFIKNSEEISQLFLMAQEFDPHIFKELEKGTLSKIAKNDENVFLFKNSIMEEIQSQEAKRVFKSLKEAIKNHEYRDIIYNSKKQEKRFIDIKPIKLIFMDNNWYVATINQKREFNFFRMSFIKEVKKRASHHHFQTKELKPYIEFLSTVQNSMTIYGKERQKATIKALPPIAKYFETDMKRFLISQKFIKKEKDGSIFFTVEYTQELEILPFIQKWLPHLVIVEPQSLRDAFKKKLQEALKIYSDNGNL